MAKNFKPCSGCNANSVVFNTNKNKYVCDYCKKDAEEIKHPSTQHNTSIVNGNGNIVIQGHSGTGDNVGGNVVIINSK